MAQKVNTNIRLDKELKQKAKEIAAEQGTNLSTIMNMYLKYFVETGIMKYKNGIICNEELQSESLSSEDAKKLKSLPEFNSLLKTFSGM